MPSLTARQLHEMGALVRLGDKFQVFALLPGEQQELLVADGWDAVCEFLARGLAEVP